MRKKPKTIKQFFLLPSFLALSLLTPAAVAQSRTGVIPWYQGQPGRWLSEVRISPGAGGAAEFSLENSSFSSEHGENFYFEPNIRAEAFGERLPARSSRSYRTTGNEEGNIAYGAIYVTITADLATLQTANVTASMTALAPDGSWVAATSVPFIYTDEATSSWRGSIKEAVGAQRSAPDATMTSLSVVNLSKDPQAVIVEVYDSLGTLVGSGKTPVLNSGSGPFGATTAYVGLLSSLVTPALKFPPTNGVLEGTLVLRGEKGEKIAPAVFRVNGSTFTSIPFRADP